MSKTQIQMDNSNLPVEKTHCALCGIGLNSDTEEIVEGGLQTYFYLCKPCFAKKDDENCA